MRCTAKRDRHFYVIIIVELKNLTGFHINIRKRIMEK